MKQTLKSGITLIIIFSLLCLVGCSFDPSDYSVVSYNIIWTECEREILTEYLPTRVYYEIAGISTDRYIGCKYRGNGIGADEDPVLMQHNDYEDALELNISSARLILSESGKNYSQEEWMSYGKNIVVEELLQIDLGIAEQLADAIVAENYFDYNGNGIYFDSSNYICDNEGKYLRLQFTLKHYDTLSWIAYILKHEGGYYIEVKKDINNPQFLVCGEEFAELLDIVFDEYNLNTKH